MSALRETDGTGARDSAPMTSIVRVEGLTKQVTTPDHVLTIVKRATFEVLHGAVKILGH